VKKGWYQSRNWERQEAYGARVMQTTKCNLVLIHWSDHALTREELAQIAERVTQIDPNISAFVVPHHKLGQLKLVPRWGQPTLSVSFLALKHRKLLPGRLLSGLLLYKHGEYERLDAAGIPVPKWTVISPETRLDPAEWGPTWWRNPRQGVVDRRCAYAERRASNTLIPNPFRSAITGVMDR
jgi:hypothetical protein